LRRNRQRADPEPDKAEAKPADGGFQAMDQMANWVRFADTKATILTAGLGVVLTMLITNAKTVAAAIKHGCVGAYVVGSLTGLTIIAVAYTLFWLVQAIGPQRTVNYKALNRFAWPSLIIATTDELTAHVANADVRQDAWRQVLDLSVLADRKFQACGRAVHGFAILVILGAACVTTAVGFTI
jgi:hypothetical protein